MRDTAASLYRSAFGTAPHAVASAPGRVNLIGEHTDYNGGPVLPVATAARTVVAVGPGDDGTVEAISTLDGQLVRVADGEGRRAGWSAYLAGVLRELRTLGAAPGGEGVRGVRVAVASDVPIGAGLASSAALSVAAAKALNLLAGPPLEPRQLAGVAFRAEHDHVGVRCGIMDQMSAALARPSHALLLECASLATRHIPIRGRLLLVDTGTRHELAQGALNERQAECEAAVARLKLELPELVWLASWPTTWLPRLKRTLPEPLRSRALHVVGETARTRFGAQLLTRGHVKRFGELLYESHESCRRLYQCSAPELDLVVATARRAGALGARLSGAGWGGAVVVLLGKGARGKGKGEQRVAQEIRRRFAAVYGRTPSITVVRPSGGVRGQRVG